MSKKDLGGLIWPWTHKCTNRYVASVNVELAIWRNKQWSLFFQERDTFSALRVLRQPTRPSSKGRLDKINRWQSENDKITASWAFRLHSKQNKLWSNFFKMAMNGCTRGMMCKKETENKLITCSTTTGLLDMLYLLSKTPALLTQNKHE
jgi:predicted acyl esterase